MYYSNKNNNIIRDILIPEFKPSYDELSSIAKTIKSELKFDSELFNTYLKLLFESINQTLAFDASSDGFASGNELRSICIDIIKNNRQYQQHPFYSHAKKIIVENPVHYCSSTMIEYYYSMLFNDYFDYAIAAFRNQIDDDVFKDKLENQYKKICPLLNDEQLIKRFQTLFYKCFMAASPTNCFMQGLVNDFIYAFTHQDPQSGKSIYAYFI